MSQSTLQHALEYPEDQQRRPEIHFETVIIGSGISGIGAGIELMNKGLGDFVILEKAEDAGGTWRDNTYPGLTVDIPSLSYSFSFEQNPRWSSLYAPGPEMKRYVDHCVTKYGVRPHMRFGVEVTNASYDEQRNLWVVRTFSGDTYTSRYLVSATGFLTVPKLPQIPGIEKFQGKVMHTGRWDHSYDLTGKRVAFIGTGATAIQAVPEIVDKVATLDVYQRTPIWLLPKVEIPFKPPVQAAFAKVPGLQWTARIATEFFTDVVMINTLTFNKYFSPIGKRLEKICVDHIRKQVDDPAVQDALIPAYDFGCKRPSFTSKFYPCFNRENVNLVTSPIERITENSMITADGTEREIDTLICATGFEVFQKGSVPTYSLVGKNGLDISDYWQQNRYQAFMGTTIPEFPNFFMIFGPYSVCTASWFGMVETQSRHLSRVIQAAKEKSANYVEVKKKSHDADYKRIQKGTRYTIFTVGDCARSNSYYFDRHGDSPTIRPTIGALHWLRTRLFRPSKHYKILTK